MPSRKSDARRSDVSVSRIVVADEDSPMAHDAPASEPAAPTSSSDAQATGTSLPALNQQSTPETKSMEKDKDKERDRDTVSIEVRRLTGAGRPEHKQCLQTRRKGADTPCIGPESTKVHHHSPGQGGAAAQHPNPGQRNTSP